MLAYDCCAIYGYNYSDFRKWSPYIFPVLSKNTYMLHNMFEMVIFLNFTFNWNYWFFEYIELCQY